MKNITKRTLALGTIILLFGIALLMVVTSLAAAIMPSAARLNNRGNDNYARQAYEEALVAYQKAQIDRPELAEPYYNAANALYRRGAYPEALEQLQVALSYSADADLAEKGFFNLGNNFFNQEQMEAAVSAFKEALLRNPADPDAKYNLELALQTQDQQEQEQEQQQQEEQQQEEQQNEDSQSEDADHSENQDDQQGEGESQNEDQQNQGEGEEQQDESGQNSGEEENQDAENQDSGSEGEEDQQNNGGQLENGDGDGQETAAESVADGELTAEQAQQLLNAIATGAQTLQEALGKIISGPTAPPAQDW